MNRQGFTLIELLIVIAIMGILLSIGTFQFSSYSKKSSIESQTRLLYGDMMEMRSKAMYEKRNLGIRLAASSYKIYSSEVMTVNPIQTVNLNTPITYNNGTDIIYDSRGMLESADNTTICINSTNEASVDSIVVSMTRITIGKKTGANCVHTGITSK